MKILRTSQLNVGGNMDFYNMLERERLESKKISKTNAVTSIMDHELPADDVHVGPSDYVPWLEDRKWAHIRVEGQAFGDVPLNVELKLEVGTPRTRPASSSTPCAAEARPQPRVAGQLDGPLLPHEVAAEPAPGPPGAGGDRGLHRRARAHRRPPRPPARRPRRYAEDKSAAVTE